MYSEKHVFEANFRTFWYDVTALYTAMTRFERYFELTCGHFAMISQHFLVFWILICHHIKKAQTKGPSHSGIRPCHQKRFSMI